MICPKCGNDAGDNCFCKKCGYNMQKKDTSNKSPKRDPMLPLKIIGFLFFGLLALSGISYMPTATTAGNMAFTFILSFISIAICAFILYSIIKRGNVKFFDDVVHKADSYYNNSLDNADIYYREKTKEADSYYQLRTETADAYFEEKRSEANQKKKAADESISNLEAEIKSLKDELSTLTEEALIKTVHVENYDGFRSDEIKSKLILLHNAQDALVKSGDAIDVISYFESNRDMNTQIKQILRCFNADCSNIIGGVTAKNIDACHIKIQRSYETINKIFVQDGVQISTQYLEAKLEELSLVYVYMVKKEEEKEQRKAIREQMVEEEKARREIEREKQKLEKEEIQFSNEVKKLMSYMQKAKDDIERQLYIDKINELEAKLKDLQADKENILQREQNTRAGFVYIISNIGSFGEQIFKIGMTRRLEPMDRIAELSSASVPFPFDVHAMIFSEDAPGLETILHQYFDEKRVNKVNPRKEFFRVSLDEIKQVVLENHNATVHFVDIPDAIEYRETLKAEQTV